MNHALTRSMVIPEIVKLIAAKYHLNEMEALDKFLYVFGLFCEEQDG